MSGSGFFRWGELIARFLSGQVLIQVINLTAGFLMLRFLNINEYAIYILASLLVSVAALGSDMGISQGVISIGAPIRDDKSAFSGLLRSAIRMRRRLFVFAVPVVALLAYVVLQEAENRIPAIVAVTVLALATAWVQQTVALGASMLNAHHDSSGLTRIGLGSALCRVILVATICPVAPFALTGLAVNLVGALVNAWWISNYCRRYTNVQRPDEQDYSKKLLAFALPLIPGAVYYSLQGQISVFLLAISGATGAVAQVGALGRLGQLIAVLGMVNGFFIQPYFARIAHDRIFMKRLAQVAGLLMLVCAAVTTSTMMLPSVWLALLGPNYAGLESELMIAMAGAQLSVAGSVIFTIVLATGVTRGQWWQIVLGLGAQFAYIALVDIREAREALVLNLIPAATSLLFQIIVLARFVGTGNTYGRRN